MNILTNCDSAIINDVFIHYIAVSHSVWVAPLRCDNKKHKYYLLERLNENITVVC